MSLLPPWSLRNRGGQFRHGCDPKKSDVLGWGWRRSSWRRCRDYHRRYRCPGCFRRHQYRHCFPARRPGSVCGGTRHQDDICQRAPPSSCKAPAHWCHQSTCTACAACQRATCRGRRAGIHRAPRNVGWWPRKTCCSPVCLRVAPAPALRLGRVWLVGLLNA